MGLLEPDGGAAMRPLATFEVALGVEERTQLGRSDGLRAVRVAAGDRSDESRQEPGSANRLPLDRDDQPVDLEIFYDDRPVRVTSEGGTAAVPEPRPGQAVRFVLRRRDESPRRLAAVLKIDGRNSLFRQTSRDVDCAKWILEPGAPPVVIRGYQQSDGSAAEFAVATDDASRRAAIAFGPATGTISLTVFPEGRATPIGLSDDAADLAAVEQADFPDAPANNLTDLQSRIRREGVGDASRGVLIEGGRFARQVRRVPFVPDPTPIFAMTIRYYEPPADTAEIPARP